MSNKLFSFLDFTRPGKDKPEPANPFARFWYRYAMRFFSLTWLNLLFFVLSLPFYVWVMTLYNSYIVGEGLKGVSLMAALLVYALDSVPAAIKIALVLASAVCWGPANAGITLVTGKYANAQHAWPWADFWRGFKANFKQGLLFGLFEMLIIFVSFYYFAQQDTIFGSYGGIAKVIWFVLLFFYLFTRVYLYPVMVSVALGTGTLFKNALLLSLIKPWRPLVCLLIVVAFALLTAVADIIVLPLLAYTFVAYSGCALTYPVLKQYLLDPAREAAQQHTEQ